MQTDAPIRCSSYRINNTIFLVQAFQKPDSKETVAAKVKKLMAADLKKEKA